MGTNDEARPKNNIVGEGSRILTLVYRIDACEAQLSTIENSRRNADDVVDDETFDSVLFSESSTTFTPVNRRAILVSHGSFNPVHIHHILMMQEARKVLEESEEEVFGAESSKKHRGSGLNRELS